MATAMILQSDGKIIAAGIACSDPTTISTICNSRTLDFALARYNPDGSLDTSFGAGGKVTTNFFNELDAIGAIAMQPNGKIIAAGTAEDNDGTARNFALARYNPDGSLDTSFGTGGKVTTDFFSDTNNELNEGIVGLAIQSDSKIVAAGDAAVATRDDLDFALARYNQNGSLDTSFGSGGKVATDFTGQHDQIGSVLIQSDGKIIAGGMAGGMGFFNSLGIRIIGQDFSPTSRRSDFALARYNQDGSLDANFGAGGKVTTDFFGLTDAAKIALQPDGKVLAVGFTQTTATSQGTGHDLSKTDFALARYLAGDAAASPTLQLSVTAWPRMRAALLLPSPAQATRRAPSR